MLDYLVKLCARRQDLEVLLFTEEPSGAMRDPDLRQRLATTGIRWVPMGYAIQGAQWMQKIRNAFQSWRLSRRFLRGHQQRWLVGFLAFGGAYAALLGKAGLGRSATVCFEPHSRYMVEAGAWRKQGLKTRVMEWLENFQLSRSDLVVAPGTAAMELAHRHRRQGRTVLQAVTIDVRKALFVAGKRAEYRTLFGWEGKTVLAYVGKFGDLYYSAGQYVRFMELAASSDRSVCFLIIATRQELDRLTSQEGFGPLRDRVVLHPPVPPGSLHQLLSAADLGVIAVPPTPSQAFRSPVKTAWYWAAGLPLVVPEGIADDWRIARDEGVGLVTGELDQLDVDRFRSDLQAIREQDPDELRSRCMAAARKYRDSTLMVDLLEVEILDADRFS